MDRVVHIINAALLDTKPRAALHALRHVDLSIEPGRAVHPVTRTLVEAGTEIITQLHAGNAQSYVRRTVAAAPPAEKGACILHLVELLCESSNDNSRFLSDAYLLLKSYIEDPLYESNGTFHGCLGLCAAELLQQIRRGEAVPGAQQLEETRRRAYVQDASRHLLRALEIDPLCDQYAAALAQVFVKCGDFDAAVRVLTNFCVVNPNNPEGFRLLCRVLSSPRIRKRSERKLVQAALHLSRCDPFSSVSWNILAEAHAQGHVPTEQMFHICRKRQLYMPSDTIAHVFLTKNRMKNPREPSTTSVDENCGADATHRPWKRRAKQRAGLA